jgi:hypothetical protein
MTLQSMIASTDILLGLAKYFRFRPKRNLTAAKKRRLSPPREGAITEKQMIRLRHVVVAAAVLLAGAAPVMAKSNSNKAQARDAVVSAEFARAVASIGQGGAFLGGQGIASVSHPSTGVTCIQLNKKTSRRVVFTSINWDASLGVALFAQWSPSNNFCGGDEKTVEIQTYKADAAGVGSALQTPVLSDQVAFVMFIP